MQRFEVVKVISQHAVCQNQNEQVNSEMLVPLSSIQHFLLCVEHLQCEFRFKKVGSDTNSNKKERSQRLYAELFMESS